MLVQCNQIKPVAVLVQPEQSYSSAGATRTELNSAGQNLLCISWWFKLQNIIINQIIFLHFNTFRTCLIRLPHLPGVPHLHVNTGPLEGTISEGQGGHRISPSGYHKGIKKERKTSNFSEIYLN